MSPLVREWETSNWDFIRMQGYTALYVRSHCRIWPTSRGWLACAGQGGAPGGGDAGAGVPSVGGVRPGGETHGR